MIFNLFKEETTMAVKSNLNGYWDEFIDTFIRALLEDGYDEFEILDKMMSSFKSIRETKIPIIVPKSVVITTNETTKETPAEIVKKTRKYPEHKKPISRINNPHNYDKTLSNKFLHAEVYVLGAENESLATIECGPSQKVRDVFKLVNGKGSFSEVDYLKKFNTEINDTPKGMSFLNRHRIVFKENPNISIGYVKHPKNYGKFASIDDIKVCTKYPNRKK